MREIILRKVHLYIIALLISIALFFGTLFNIANPGVIGNLALYELANCQNTIKKEQMCNHLLSADLFELSSNQYYCELEKLYDEICFDDLNVNTDLHYRIIIDSWGTSLISNIYEKEGCYFLKSKQIPFFMYNLNYIQNKNSDLILTYTSYNRLITNKQWEELTLLLKNELQFWEIQQIPRNDFKIVLIIDGIKEGEKKRLYFDLDIRDTTSTIYSIAKYASDISNANVYLGR